MGATRHVHGAQGGVRGGHEGDTVERAIHAPIHLVIVLDDLGGRLPVAQHDPDGLEDVDAAHAHVARIAVLVM